MPNAVLLLSELGLAQMVTAGLTTGWIRAWLLSAGAESVEVRMINAETRPDHDAVWQLFFGSADEVAHLRSEWVNDAAWVDGTCSDMGSEVRSEMGLDNPLDGCFLLSNGHRRILLLAAGDIAFQRQTWIAALNDGARLQQLHVMAGDALPIALEPGLSATLSKPQGAPLLNSSGMLPEEQVVAVLKAKRLQLATVESCTAGGIAARLARLPGASAVLDRGWVTYSNAAKQQEVDVDGSLLAEYGAVSEPVVCAMAEHGAGDSRLALAVSGIAGPGGGSAQKPVGTVWIALAAPGLQTVSRVLNLPGSRAEVQSRTTIAAFQLLLEQFTV